MNNKDFRKTDFFVGNVMCRIGGRVEVLSGRVVDLSSKFGVPSRHVRFAVRKFPPQ